MRKILLIAGFEDEELRSVGSLQMLKMAAGQDSKVVGTSVLQQHGTEFGQLKSE